MIITRFTLTLAISAAMLASAAQAQTVVGLDGRWEGALSVSDVTLNVVMRIATTDGDTVAVLDSPDQGAFDIPATVTRAAAAVALDVAEVGGGFKGDLSADKKSITGIWSQGGQDLPLVLTRK